MTPSEFTDKCDEVLAVLFYVTAIALLLLVLVAATVACASYVVETVRGMVG